jgi:hypothetical protein
VAPLYYTHERVVVMVSSSMQPFPLSLSNDTLHSIFSNQDEAGCSYLPSDTTRTPNQGSGPGMKSEKESHRLSHHALMTISRMHGSAGPHPLGEWNASQTFRSSGGGVGVNARESHLFGKTGSGKSTTKLRQLSTASDTQSMDDSLHGSILGGGSLYGGSLYGGESSRNSFHSQQSLMALAQALRSDPHEDAYQSQLLRDSKGQSRKSDSTSQSLLGSFFSPVASTTNAQSSHPSGGEKQQSHLRSFLSRQNSSSSSSSSSSNPLGGLHSQPNNQQGGYGNSKGGKASTRPFRDDPHKAVDSNLLVHYPLLRGLGGGLEDLSDNVLVLLHHVLLLRSGLSQSLLPSGELDDDTEHEGFGEDHAESDGNVADLESASHQMRADDVELCRLMFREHLAPMLPSAASSHSFTATQGNANANLG